MIAKASRRFVCCSTIQAGIVSDAARGQRVTSAKNVLMSCLHSTARASAGAGLHTYILLPVLLFHAMGQVFILLGEILVMLFSCMIF